MRRVLAVSVLGMGLILCAVSCACAWPWGGKAETKTKQAAAPAEAPAPPAAVQAQGDRPAAEAPAPPVQEEEEVQAPPAPAAPVLSEAELAKMRAQKNKKREAVDGNRWDVAVVPLTGKGEKTADALIFADNKFYSEEYQKKGYAASNYTLSLADDGRVVVETMQSGEKMGIVFWRVEFDDKLTECRGVISCQLSGNKTEDYSFVSTAKRPMS